MPSESDCSVFGLKHLATSGASVRVFFRSSNAFLWASVGSYFADVFVSLASSALGPPTESGHTLEIVFMSPRNFSFK